MHRAIDLFSGAGGFSLAARAAGFEVIVSCEKNSHACSTYRRNLISRLGSKTNLIEGDIQDLDPTRVRLESGLRRGELDLIIGGPPCQGFTLHNPQNRDSNDLRNKLVLTYLSFVEEFSPKFFVIENVPGLLLPHHRWVLEIIFSRAETAGYVLEKPVVLNARDFGIPQNRRRTFLLGKQRQLVGPEVWPPEKTHFAPDSFEVCVEGRPSWRNARCVFDRALPEGDPNAIHMKSGKILTEVFASTPKDGGSRHESCRTLECHSLHKGHRDVYGRIDTTKCGPTMTTACVNPSKGRFVHPWENRGISVRHAARFQSFPDDFIFDGGLSAAGSQVGNAVPPDLGYSVLSPIIESLRRVPKDSN